MEALDVPMLQTRKPTDNTMSISAFFCSIEEIVQIPIRLKSKMLYYNMLLIINTLI